MHDAPPQTSPGTSSGAESSAATQTLVVAGDLAVDWYAYPVAAADPAPANAPASNWRTHPSRHYAALPGGALLTAHFLEQLAPGAVRPPALPGDLRDLSPEAVVHSNAILDFFPAAPGATAAALRVREAHGFIGPADGLPPLAPPAADAGGASLVVLDDLGNGFRDTPAAWPAALDAGADPWIVHRAASPLARGPLWEKLDALDSRRRVLVVDARDLRALPGVQISTAISWEKTAREFVFQMQSAPALAPLRDIAHLVVLFGLEGAILYRGREFRTPSTLVFDPANTEGSIAARTPGTVFGLTSMVTASIAASAAASGDAGLERAIARGLALARRFLAAGYAADSDRPVAWPSRSFFEEAAEHPAPFHTCDIAPPDSSREADPRFWRILDQVTRNTRALAAEEVARTGRSPRLAAAPVGKFHFLETIDRAEIESYNAIRCLIEEFLDDPAPPRPLSFAVFGPPGSGKSFGVKQVVKSLGRDDIQSVTFNISQFRSYDDLVASLHEVRDIGLEGNLPFVFFDEFDAASNGEPLAWLKYFLAPMQDAEFRDGAATHPVGKAIFVFAGGTRSTFEEFQSNAPPAGEDAGAGYGTAAFRQAKGPDFVSRLRGFINIMGPNRQHAHDDAFVIRRAKVLNFLLNSKAKQLRDPATGAIRIDDGVLRALLAISAYRHGTRSLESVIDMSRLAGETRFGPAALPPSEQLELHVDAAEFLHLAARERFLCLLPPRDLPAAGATPLDKEHGLVEEIARRLHEDYLRQRRVHGEESPSALPWDDLPELKRESNRNAAADIPAKLRAVGHGLRRIGSPTGMARTPDITDAELEALARLEHDRWCSEQTLQGFRLGDQNDPLRKTSPYLVPFDKLTPEVQAYDFQSVSAIPGILAGLGYELYRMEEVARLPDPALVEDLARLLHEDYCRQRAADGDTPGSNPSIVPWEELPADLVAANLDSAATIPRKLRAIGYDLKKLVADREPDILELSGDEVEKMAIIEHARWNWQKRLQGWTWKPGPKDLDNKTTPHLVAWADLPEDIREYDRENVRLIPSLLHRARYEAVPL